MIPRAASKLRPYLLAALVLAIIPLALLITNRFGGASANITNPDGANASAPRASDAISTTASETVSEPSNEEGSADGTTDALNGPAATDFESDTNSEPSATLDQISAPPEPTDEGSTDGGVEEDGADETPPSDAPQDTESPKNESEEPQDAVADASSAPPDDKEAPDEPSESTQTEESEAPAEPLSETPKDESEGTEEEEGSKGLVMYSSTTDLNRTNTQLPNLKGAWKCKISDSACYMSVTSQTGDRVSATISIEEEDGSWTEIQLQGRYNTTLNMLRLDQVSGGRAVFKGEINGKQLHGSATIHAGAARVTWTASR